MWGTDCGVLRDLFCRLWLLRSVKGEHENGGSSAHTCLESPQVSGRHGESVAPLGVAHVRGEAVIQSVSWAHKKHRQVRTLQTGKGP